MRNKAVQARRQTWARLLLILTVLLCLGCLARQAAGLFRKHPRTALVRAENALLTRALPENDAGKMNINLATAQDLQRVSGIGPVLSQRIVEARDELDGFHFLEEVKDVSGVGEKRFEALAELFFCLAP